MVFLGAQMTVIIYSFLNIMKANLWSRFPDTQHTDYLVTLDYIFPLQLFSLPFHPKTLNEMVRKYRSSECLSVSVNSLFYFRVLTSEC